MDVPWVITQTKTREISEGTTNLVLAPRGSPKILCGRRQNSSVLVIRQEGNEGNSPADEATTDGHLLPFIHHTGRLAGHYSILIIAPGFFISITGFKPMQKIGWVTKHRVEQQAHRNYQFFKQRTEPSKWVLNWGIREYRYIIIWTQTVGHHHASAIQYFIFSWANFSGQDLSLVCFIV